MKCRLVLWEDCNRACIGCCNKDWDMKAIPELPRFENYETYLLTGGEPMLYSDKVVNICQAIKANTQSKIILYTAKVDDQAANVRILPWIDGITVTLHEQKDVEHFIRFANRYHGRLKTKSLRLNIFEGVHLPALFAGDWSIKDGIEWIKDCPLSKDEVIYRMPV